MSSCDRIGVAPAMDMPEVLKSLLEHSLPWPEKRTGRSTEGLCWQAAQVPKGWGQAQGQWQDRIGRAPSRGLPLDLFWAEDGVWCRGGSGEVHGCHSNPGVTHKAWWFGELLWPVCSH